MKLKTLSLLAASAIALAACSTNNEADQPAAETNIETTVEETTTVTNAVEAPAPVETTAAVAPPAPVTLTPDEQTADDAAATGMTAKVDRNADAEEVVR